MLLRPFLQYADGLEERPWKLEGVKVGSWNLKRFERVMVREGEMAGKKGRGRSLIMLGANYMLTPGVSHALTAPLQAADLLRWIGGCESEPTQPSFV